uniref:Uncharacterized protein n=1 Tax=Anguilla anguilla TaxID=7936 RepID=A0A0E9X784_ANGAN
MRSHFRSFDVLVCFLFGGGDIRAKLRQIHFQSQLIFRDFILCGVRRDFSLPPTRAYLPTLERYKTAVM